MKSYLCYRAPHPLPIDGTMTDSAWEAAPWTDEFVDIEGDLKPAPRFKTRVKMLWDDTYLYIGADMEEPHVWGTLTEHDSVIFQDNDFEVFIDPDADNHEYYELEINALNTTWDLRLVKPYRDGGPALNEWEIPGMRTAVSINGTLNDPSDTDHGWKVEIALPWNVLKEYAQRSAPPLNGDQWRINFSRVEWDIDIVNGEYQKVANRPEHNWVWSPQGVIDMHRPENWGIVQFTTDAPGTGTLIPDPSLSARDFLMKVYYAQHDFKNMHGRFALADELDLMSEENLRVQIEEDGFDASVSFQKGENKSRIHVRHDSKIWIDENPCH